MWLNEESPIRKQDIHVSKPFVNSSGTLGFAPDPHGLPFLDELGAFITNPVSRQPRKPARNRACLPFEGGFLLHTGLQNPGISRAISRYKRRWAGAPLPIIIHLLAETPESLSEMIRKLEGLENILAIELGLPPDCDSHTFSTFYEAALGELPVVVCLTPEQIPSLLETLKMTQPVGVHLMGSRGMLPGLDNKSLTGRLYGPAIFPIMLKAAQSLVQADLRVIADGGVYTRWQADAFIEMGVTAVGLGCVLWGIESGSLFSND